jgi:integrase
MTNVLLVATAFTPESLNYQWQKNCTNLVDGGNLSGIGRPYLILGMYAGIRPEELMRLDWSAVDLVTKTVKVDGKTRRRRIVPLEPKAVNLLASFPLRTGPIATSYSIVRRIKHKAAAILGFKDWPHDVLRHTAASYLLALYGDAGKVSTMLGNSSAILLTHYHEPVSKADCERFWATPQNPNDYCI